MKWYSNHRQHAHYHGNVDKHIQKIVCIQADNHQFSKIIVNSECKNISHGNNQNIKQNQCQAANHAKLLRKHRKNKIRMLFR